MDLHGQFSFRRRCCLAWSNHSAHSPLGVNFSDVVGLGLILFNLCHVHGLVAVFDVADTSWHRNARLLHPRIDDCVIGIPFLLRIGCRFDDLQKLLSLVWVVDCVFGFYYLLLGVGSYFEFLRSLQELFDTWTCSHVQLFSQV
jgi:hypothetical protein